MKYLILGAGPAGLTFANILKNKGEDSFLLLEKENEAGGLCRSIIIDNSPFDIGGGHFLDVKRENVNDFLFGFMPKEEWNIFVRDSRINIHGNIIGHPIESNIWQMPIEEQIKYLKSIAIAGCNIGEPMPKDFISWIYWKLGKCIADNYMIPYNQKMFNKELNQLGTYWLEKLPNVSFDETLLSCLEKKAYGTQPGHSKFYYPKKYGYGELWKRMADNLGDNIVYDSAVESIDIDGMKVNTSNGDSYCADIIISTVPWTSLKNIEGIPIELKKIIKKLKYSSIETRYFEENIDTNAHWIYYPDSSLAYHRILVRSNFCQGSKGYWTETNSQRIDLIPKEDKNNFNYINEYAYPLNTIDKPVIMQELLKFLATKNIIGLGRWGEWQHYNSDVTVEKAMNLAKKICG